MSVNPSQANGLGACSEAEFARESATSLPGEGCPESAKIGTVSARSPVLEETAEGSLYVATPHQNPFGSLIALYMVLKIPNRGVGVKLAGKVAPDPTTGQLVTTFDEIPQLPISSFDLHFREGARSPLVTPPACGTYTSIATFTSWGGQVVTTRPSFEVTGGANGGPCQSGALPFRPGFEAGAINNNAGFYSPYTRLSRNDGEQELTRFSTKLPPGSLAKLAGVSSAPMPRLRPLGQRAEPRSWLRPVVLPDPRSLTCSREQVSARPLPMFPAGPIWPAPTRGISEHRRDRAGRGRPVRPRHSGRA